MRSCYRKLRGEITCSEYEFLRKLWQLKLPRKVLNLIWRACRRCLPKASVLVIKIVNIHPACSWCQLDLEDDLHVLFSCSFAQKVWKKAGLSRLVTVEPNDTFLLLLKRVFQIGHKGQILMVGLLCWNLCREETPWFGIMSRYHLLEYIRRHAVCWWSGGKLS